VKRSRLCQKPKPELDDFELQKSSPPDRVPGGGPFPQEPRKRVSLKLDEKIANGPSGGEDPLLRKELCCARVTRHATWTRSSPEINLSPAESTTPRCSPKQPPNHSRAPQPPLDTSTSPPHVVVSLTPTHLYHSHHG
jgi:hypothetical protein